MRLTAPTKAFSDGFSENDDIFNRKQLHDIIMRVASNAPDKSLVLALDDQWGNGKTSFVKMMSSEIRKSHAEQFDVIYFDAFENDYQSDPFVALTSKIYALVNKENGKLKNLGQELLSIGKKLGASFAINGAKFAVSTLTGGLVSGSAIEKAGDAISDSLSSPIEAFIEEKIKTGENELATIDSFKALLTKIHKESERKIIFIIDELDRARPDFALDLLEKIKHIFSVEGFVFLLVINRAQFEKSIECRYGNINSRLYLNKFIHYWFTLPKKNLFAEGCLVGYERSTLTHYLLNIDHENLLSRNGSLVKTLAYLLEINNCSLREAERCYATFAVMKNPFEISNYRHEILQVAIGFVAFLKVHNQELLVDIMYKRIPLEEVLTQMKIIDEKSQEVTEVYYIMMLLKYHYLTDKELSSVEVKQEYAFMTGIANRRLRWLEAMFANVQGFTVN
ncbi:P-loop NTPase fold protein [Enterobacter hormaechei subsp. steigerwaltii]